MDFPLVESLPPSNTGISKQAEFSVLMSTDFTVKFMANLNETNERVLRIMVRLQLLKTETKRVIGLDRTIV